MFAIQPERTPPASGQLPRFLVTTKLHDRVRVISIRRGTESVDTGNGATGHSHIVIRAMMCLPRVSDSLVFAEVCGGALRRTLFVRQAPHVFVFVVPPGARRRWMRSHTSSV